MKAKEYKKHGIQIIDNETSHKIIETRKPEGLFLTIENRRMVAIDNTSGNAWTEDFRNEKVALRWLKGEIDTEEAYRLDKEVMDE